MKIYDKLLRAFGKQNWWPMSNAFRPPEWEIWIGAILTQNTNWKNVEKALQNLKNHGLLSKQDIIRTKQDTLAKLIKPSGYYNQKAKKLRKLASFQDKPTREALLSIWGIGPETADSILLYACGKPYFVIDAYTRRVFSRIGLLEKDMPYDDMREFFESRLPRDTELYREYHALIVELAKRFCRKTPKCSECPISSLCQKSLQASGMSRKSPMRKQSPQMH